MQRADDAAERAVRTFAATMIGEVAHELNNRLATLRETVGLLEDLARAGKSGAAATARAHASLDDQVGRALNIVRTLGGLGDALASAAGGFDVGATTADLLGMTERWARRVSQRVERDFASGLPAAAGDPAIYLCLVHRLLARSAAALQAGGSILVRIERAGAGIRVRLVPNGARAEGAAAPSGDDVGIDRELANRLGGELLLEGGGAATIMLATVR
jgi:signal transduction histidine kinase